MGALTLAGAALVAACSVGPSVEVERSEMSTGALEPDRDVFTAGRDPSVPGDQPDDADDAGAGTPESSTIAWAGCEGFGIPDVDRLGTERWECARVEVAMNPDDPDGGLPPVSIALTRHPATGDRFGTILVNPGGPGGAGLPLAWSIRPALPTELLRGFDVVAWDPRGVGQSEPAIGCPSDATPDDLDFIARCVEQTGPLSAFLSAPYSVADMEAIRVALGEDRLDYLGFSYGSILGAVYAERHPARVGSFVLDGVTDPDVGGSDGPYSGGFPTFADDGLPAALDRFAEICDASLLCLPGLDAASALDSIVDGAGDLTTDDYAFAPDELTSPMVGDHFAFSMQGAAEWELLAAALGDAADGDGSALAAHISMSGLLPADDGEQSPNDDPSPDDGSAPDNFEAANFLIYCADLGPFVRGPTFCDDMPAAADRLEPVTAVDLERELLLIGTEFDPLTPGYHADEFAERVGDAVVIVWEGVGHTAFPGWTRCIDDVVVDQFLGRALPEPGLRCPFIDGVASDDELGEELFGFGPLDGRPWLEEVFLDAGVVAPSELECVVDALVPDEDVDHEVVAELILGVTSDEAVAALDDAQQGC